MILFNTNNWVVIGVISSWHYVREVIIRVSVFGWATLLAFSLNLPLGHKYSVAPFVKLSGFQFLGCLKKTHLFCVKTLNLYGNCSYVNDTVLVMRLWPLNGLNLKNIYIYIYLAPKMPCKFMCSIGSNQIYKINFHEPLYCWELSRTWFFGELLDMISFLTTHCICHEVQQLCQKLSASFAATIYIRTVIYMYTPDGSNSPMI